MASVAKWLRQWFVVPPFVGSIPIIRPHLKNKKPPITIGAKFLLSLALGTSRKVLPKIRCGMNSLRSPMHPINSDRLFNPNKQYSMIKEHKIIRDT